MNIIVLDINSIVLFFPLSQILNKFLLAILRVTSSLQDKRILE